MKLTEQIKEDIKSAMRAKEADKLTTLRGVVSGFTNELVATGKTPQDEVTDEIAMTVLKRQAKQRKDSIEQFTKGGRDDLVKNEQAELAIIETYLPETMSKEDIQIIAKEKKEEMGISDKSKMGQLMGAIMGELKGKEVDGSDVKEVVESLFN